MDNLHMRGKVALVTGGSRGIGLAIAEAFLAAGASVCVTARKKDELDAAVAHLTSLIPDGGGTAIAFAGQAGDRDQVRACVDHVMAELGRVDVLVNNAATNPAFGPLVNVEPAAWRKTFDVNLDGPLWFTQAVWHAWMAEHGGVVLNISTQGTYGVAPALGAYETSKAALVHMSKQLAGELAPGVRVNIISPGLVKTRMSRVMWERDEAAAAGTIPLGRIGMPDDIGAAAVFLASDQASWITGADLLVDGGSHVRSAAPRRPGGDGIADRLREGT